MNINLITKDFTILEKSVDDKERSIKQYISTVALDRGNDIMLPEGLDETNFRKNPVVLFNHNTDMVIGKNLWLQKEENGVLSKTQFANTPFADDIYILNKEGCLNAWSVRFVPRKWNYDQEKGITVYTDWELIEYSSVSIPMNQDALNVAKSMIKSDMAKEILKNTENEFEMKQILTGLTKEINALKEAQDEMNKLLRNTDIDSFEIIENNLFELKKEIEEIKNRLQKSVGTLDNKRVFKEVLDEVVRDVS